MEEKKTAFVRLVPDTTEIDELKAKLDELNEALEKANSLIEELAAKKVSVTLERKNVDELANQIKNRMLSAKFIPEKNSSVSSGSSPEQTRTNVDFLEV